MLSIRILLIKNAFWYFLTILTFRIANLCGTLHNHALSIGIDCRDQQLANADKVINHPSNPRR